RAWTCAATSPGRCWTTSSGPTATRSASASCTWTSRRSSARPRRARASTRTSSTATAGRCSRRDAGPAPAVTRAASSSSRVRKVPEPGRGGPEMRVFVAGATGAIGRPLVRQLIDRGHHVTAMTRSAGKVDSLRRLGAEAVVADGLDAAAVGEAVARAEPDAIIHQMTALSGPADLRRFDRWFAATNALRTRGTEHLLAAARAAGVRRVIAQSFTGWTNAREGGWVKSEDDPLDP